MFLDMGEHCSVWLLLAKIGLPVNHIRNQDKMYLYLSTLGPLHKFKEGICEDKS